MWVGFCAALMVVSPKCQFQLVYVPVPPDGVAVKATLSGAGPERGFPVADTDSGTLVLLDIIEIVP